jgi:glycerophosphoryl diester phosphodiesterase
VSAWTGPTLVVGHRGGRGEGWPPENTLAAFEHAARQGTRAIELDVRTCAGDEVVVFHDASLERMSGGRDAREVREVPLSELRGVDLGGGARIPGLVEVLDWARSQGVAVNVELKHDVPSRPTLARETLRIVGEARADVIVSSFDPVLLALGAARALSVPRALLTHARQRAWATALQAAVRVPAVQALHLEWKQVGPSVARYLRKGLRVGAWTVNDLDEAVRLARLGVASIITDRPGDVLRELTRSRPG